MGWIRQDLQPGQPGFGELICCPECNPPAKRIHWFQERSGLTDALLTYSLEEWYVAAGSRHEAALVAKRFVEDPRFWITLWGGFGTGKTYLLAAICNALILRQTPVYYQTGPGLLNALRATLDEKGQDSLQTRLYQLARIPVLAIDELDKVRLTEFARESLFELLEFRYRNLRTCGTLLAMNANPRDLPEEWGYLVSRVYDARSMIIELSGVDLRKIQH